MGVLMVELVYVLVEERMGVDEAVGDVEEAVEGDLEEEQPADCEVGMIGRVRERRQRAVMSPAGRRRARALT